MTVGKPRIPLTMANFHQDENLAWKQLLSALNNEPKRGSNRCHFKPCDIRVLNVSIMCSVKKKKKKENKDYQMISGTQICMLNFKDTAFCFNKLLNRLSFTPSPPLLPQPSLTHFIHAYTDVDPNLDFQI